MVGRHSIRINHDIATQAAKFLLASVVDDPAYGVTSPRVATGSDPLVAVGLVSAAGRGAVLPCVNWAGKLLPDFKLTLLLGTGGGGDLLANFASAELASGGLVTVSTDRTTFTFDLAEDADALILRPADVDNDAVL